MNAPEQVQQLIEISRHYGVDSRFVIAGGGNTSYKNAEKLWVKASGSSLATITEEGFAVLDRAKLTTDVRNKAVTYAQTALDRHLKPDYAKLVTVTGSIPQFQMLQLDIAIARPDGSEMSISIKQRWEAQANAV